MSARDAIHDAAMEELLRVGLDDFNLNRVARRAEVDPSVITAYWGDRRVLLMDAINTRAKQSVPVPDTGSLRADLRSLVTSLSALADTDQGRKWYHCMIASGHDADLYEVAVDFWDGRFAAMASVLQRAADRGELRDDIRHADALRMLSAALYFDVIYYDAPVRTSYADHVTDIFARGISR